MNFDHINTDDLRIMLHDTQTLIYYLSRSIEKNECDEDTCALLSECMIEEILMMDELERRAKLN